MEQKHYHERRVIHDAMRETLTVRELLLRTTVLITINTGASSISGTGFLFSSHQNVFLVTNKHVIKGAKEIELKFYRMILPSVNCLIFLLP